MSIEAIIGVIYCLVTLVFIVGMVVRAHQRQDFGEPEKVITAGVWPLLIVLWLIHRKRSTNTGTIT